MKEEGKKTEGKKLEEMEKEKKAEEIKEPPSATATEDPSPTPEIVLKVFMHCEGCAKKVRKCLKGFQGVEDVKTDCKAQKVVVKGEKADPTAVMNRIQQKSHRQVELLSPIPKPQAEDANKLVKKVEIPPEKKEEAKVITVVLRVQMHCEACAQEIRRRILKMSGVEEVEPDLKSSQVTVKGIFDTPKLLEFFYKRTGKHAIIVKQEPDNKKEEEKGKKDKKADADGNNAGKKDGAEVATPPPAEGDAANVVEVKKNEFYSNYQQNYHINPPYSQNYHINPPDSQNYHINPYPQYAPQIFSDENPNACSVM